MLLLPGPTPLPDAVLQAQMRPMENHRGPRFETCMAGVRRRITALFGTEGDVAVLPSSGSGGLEATVQNLWSPGDRILAVVGGVFGQRFHDIAKRSGLDVTRLEVPYGEAPTVEMVQQALEAAPFQGLLLTHNETSTGVLAPVAEIAHKVHRPGLLIAVDTISGFPSVPLPLDEGHIDAAIACTQKGFMSPPGLSMVGLGPAGLARVKEDRDRPFYFDLRPYVDGKSPYTPAVSLVYALDAALDLLEEEGAAAREQRHVLMSGMTRAAGSVMGLEPLAADDVASPTVTALKVPQGVAPGALRAGCERRGLVLGGGQGSLKNSIVRVGHVGYVFPPDIVAGMGLIQQALEEAGHEPEGNGALAAERIHRQHQSGRKR